MRVPVSLRPGVVNAATSHHQMPLPGPGANLTNYAANPATSNWDPNVARSSSPAIFDPYLTADQAARYPPNYFPQPQFYDGSGPGSRQCNATPTPTPTAISNQQPRPAADQSRPPTHPSHPYRDNALPALPPRNAPPAAAEPPLAPALAQQLEHQQEAWAKYDQKRKQEEEDEALARRMMMEEEEGAQHVASGSLTTLRSLWGRRSRRGPHHQR